jgi:hypothetical protein
MAGGLVRPRRLECGSPGLEVLSEKDIAWRLVGVEEEEVCGVLRVPRLLHHLIGLKQA